MVLRRRRWRPNRRQIIWLVVMEEVEVEIFKKKYGERQTEGVVVFEEATIKGS